MKRTRDLRNSDIRYIDYNPAVNAESDAGFQFDEGYSDNIRDSVLKANQLLDPQGCTVITACSPNGIASETEFGNRTR
jgi:metal-dependent hydrolase (beta-lactamase superfamily II)